jgi:hypothetical protein
VTPWISEGLSFIPGLSTLDLTFAHITFLLGAAMLLAFIAAVLGSGRWAFIALIDLATFILLVFVVNLQERH